MRFEDIKDILIKEYDLSRSQIRASEEWHVKISLIYTISIFVAASGIISLDKTQVLANFNKDYLFVFINLLVLAQFSFLLNYHIFYIILWGKYTELLEEKINVLYESNGLLEFESHFSPIYFAQKNLKNRFSKYTNQLLVILIHAPSIFVYFSGLLVIYNINSNKTIEYSLVILGIIAFFILGFLYFIQTNAVKTNLENAKKESINNFKDWLKSNKKENEDDFIYLMSSIQNSSYATFHSEHMKKKDE